jgi:hypothetical protein
MPPTSSSARRGAEALFDIAGDAADFAQFKREAEAFLRSSVAPLSQAWLAALDEVRQRKYADPHLPVQAPETHPIEFEVVELMAQADGAKKNTVEGGIRAARLGMGGLKLCLLEDVWRSLDICLPGCTRTLRTHHWWVHPAWWGVNRSRRCRRVHMGRSDLMWRQAMFVPWRDSSRSWSA